MPVVTHLKTREHITDQLNKFAKYVTGSGRELCFYLAMAALSNFFVLQGLLVSHKSAASNAVSAYPLIPES